MRAFNYARSFPVTWQRWRSNHSIRHSQKSHATRKLHCSMFYRTGVIADGSFTLREYGFFDLLCSCDLDLDPMTFIYEPDPYSLEIHPLYKYELFMSRLSKVIVWQTDRQTDKKTQPKLYTTPLRGWPVNKYNTYHSLVNNNNTVIIRPPVKLKAFPSNVRRRPPDVSREGLKSFLFFLFYQSTALSNNAMDGQSPGHQMYFGGSVIGKASTIGIEILSHPPLIFTGGQKVRNLVVFNITQLWAARVWKCSKISERWKNMIALCPYRVWWSWVHAPLRTVCQSCPTPKIARRKRAKSSTTQLWITDFAQILYIV